MNLIVAGLSAKRITQLVVMDEITSPIRDVVADWAKDSREGSFRDRVEYLINCPACTSVWAAALAIGLESSRAGRLLNRVMAASAGALLLNALEERR